MYSILFCTLGLNSQQGSVFILIDRFGSNMDTSFFQLYVFFITLNYKAKNITARQNDNFGFWTKCF